MSSDDEIEAERARLADAELIIRALEALATESETRGLEALAARIGDCVTKCQDDYLARQRKLFSRTRRPH
jgi:hypothetical protein